MQQTHREDSRRPRSDGGAALARELAGVPAGLVERLADPVWRLGCGGIYHLKDRSGRARPFVPNAVQREFIAGLHTRNIVLKARQLGITTVSALMLLDEAIFGEHRAMGIIAQDLGTAQAVFEHIVLFAYDRLPAWLAPHVRSRHRTRQELSIARTGSSVSADTSFRGRTLQGLLVSEYARVCRDRPAEAREIATGALNTVPADGRVIMESTAEGPTGDFADRVRAAERLHPDSLGSLEWRLHFFPWWREPSYRLTQGESISAETRAYFEGLSAHPSYRLAGSPVIDEARMRWYQSKRREQGSAMLREFPSVPEEAFEVRLEGAYYGRELARTADEGRIMSDLSDDSLDTHTAWDIGGAGGGDDTAIWYYQLYRGEIRVIDYWEGSGYALGEIVDRAIRSRPYRYGTHVFPHDLRVREFGGGATRFETAVGLLGSSVRVLPRGSIADGIEAARRVIGQARFDEARTRAGRAHLASYRRDEGLDRPRHDAHSHAADAWRYLAVHVETLLHRRPAEGSFAMEHPAW